MLLLFPPRQSQQNKSKSEEALLGLLALGFGGILAVAGYSFQANSFVSGVGIATIGFMSAGAAALIGALLGFLFGIPRTLQQEHQEVPVAGRPTDQVENSSAIDKRPTYMANTNLEQISDWLTKILVGVGLTQLTDIQKMLGKITSFIAQGLSSGPNDQGSHAFAFGLIIFYLTCGFLFGYLWTRLFLPSAFREADLDKLVDQRVDSKIDKLKQQDEADAKALSLAYHILNPTTDSQEVIQAELNSVIEKASRSVKMQIFYQAKQFRSQYWRDYDSKPMMELTIPIFRALIASDPSHFFHKNHAQLGYALKDKRDPSWTEAELELSRAIDIRNKLDHPRQPFYEFNRAICQIHLDSKFATKEPSDPATKKKILEDINEAMLYTTVKEIALGDPTINEWARLNDVTLNRN